MLTSRFDNKSRYLTLALSLVTTVLFWGCSGGSDKKPFELENSDNLQSVDIIRLDTVIEGYAVLPVELRDSVIAAHRRELTVLGKFIDDADTVTDVEMLTWSTWPVTTMFMPEVRSVFSDLTSEEAALARILASAEQNGMELPASQFVTAVWSDRRSIMVADTVSTVYIALNHYLGPNNKAYQGWPEYMRNLKRREMIPVDVAETLVSIARPYKPEQSNTVLSRLLYEGALAVAKQSMVPDAPLSDILGFTQAELADIENNEAFVWKQLGADNNLYSSDTELISNLFDRRSNSSRISADAPGRTARYVGYRIVSSYLENNPETSLDFLLSPDFYGNGTEVLRKAHYSPAK